MGEKTNDVEHHVSLPHALALLYVINIPVIIIHMESKS